MSVQLIITDHDGVIADIGDLVYCAAWNLCSRHNLFGSIPTPPFTDFLEKFRLPGGEWFASHGFDFPLEVVTETLRHAPNNAKMFSAVPLMLKTLRDRCPKLPIIMISAGDEPRIEGQLGKWGIRRYFDKVIGNNPSKTEAIYFFCLAFGINPKEAVYIGDMPSDMEHGCEAGVMTIGFTDDRPMMRRILTAAGAKHCVPNHQALGDLLLELAA